MPHPSKQNLALLQQGIEVLQELSPALYSSAPPAYAGASAGKHVRHILNFYECFADGVAAGRIDYDARRRDTLVETDPDIAVSRMRHMMKILSTLTWQVWNEPVLVKQNEGEEADIQGEFSRSTIGREMQGLVSHTVHHYAIIAIILRIHGIETPAGFGVAPSTLKYQRSMECVQSRG